MAELNHLRNQIKTIKAEQSELYKTNANNSQRVLNLLDVQQDLQIKIQSLEQSLKTTTKELEATMIKLEDAQGLLKEKDKVIQVDYF